MEKPNLIIYGKVIALSDVQEVASKEAGKPAMKKRKLYMDCTRYDYLTGERIGFENKPLLEFGGDKVMDKLSALNLQKDDIVGVRFDIHGNPYKDEKTGKTSVFTNIRCYDVEILRRAGKNQQQQVQQQAPAPQAAQAQQPQAQPQEPVQTSQDGTDGLPF